MSHVSISTIVGRSPYTHYATDNIGKAFKYQESLPEGVALQRPHPTNTDASCDRMRTFGVNHLFIRVGSLRVWDHFLVSTNLATPCLLKTTFIDKHVTAIHPQRKQVAFHHSRPVALLSATARFQTNNVHESFPTTDKSISNEIRLTRAVSIPPITQAEVQVIANVVGLSFLQLNPKTVKKRLMLMVNGVMELIPNRSFRVLVSNVGQAPIHLAKNSILRHAMPAPIALISPSSFIEDDETKGGEANPNQTDQDQRSDTAKADDWIKKVRIGEEYETERERITDFLEPFSDMWDGHLGSISIANHRIHLEEGSKPIFQIPYRAGQKRGELEREEVTKQLRVA